MAYNSYTNTSSAGGCPTLPPCPACGGLECMCRPRFYAGQQLTADDLNRLENYVVAKNKLHNRYLNGWGVVCGLEVICSPCGDTVRVKPGYALSPCGNDIIVCNDSTVAICSLIQACSPASTPDCLSPWQTTQDTCKDATDDWILAICYDEKQSRGSQSFGGANNGSGSRCACSGTSSCGCGCQSSTGKTSTSHRRTPSIQAPQCEPTLICEGYTYRVYKAPPKKEGVTDRGAFLDRFATCIDGWVQQYQKVNQLPQNSNKEKYQWCCNFKQFLYDLMATEGLYNCTLADDLRKIQCPDPNSKDFAQAWINVRNQLFIIFWDILKYCLCSALLPPCPEPVTTDCVPLATITVRRSDCRIIKICDLKARKFAVTLPNLGYWLSILNSFITQPFREYLENLCCRPLDISSDRSIAFNNNITGSQIVGDQPTRSNILVNALAAETLPDTNSTKPPEGEISSLFHLLFSIFSPEKTTQDSAASVSAKTTPSVSATNSTVSTNNRIPPEKEFTTLLYQAFLNPDRGFDAKALVLFNLLGAKDANGNPLLSDLESRNPAQFLLLNQVIAPLIRNAMPEPSRILTDKASTNASMANVTTVQAAEIARLRKTVDDLTAKVELLCSKLSN